MPKKRYWGKVPRKMAKVFVLPTDGSRYDVFGMTHTA